MFLSFLNFKIPNNSSLFLALFEHVLTFSTFAIIKWIFLGLIVELLSNVFARGGHLKEFLTLTSFAMLPMIFLAPAELFKTAGGVGYIIGALIEIYVFIRVFYLYLKSAQLAYSLNLAQALILFCIPFGMSILAIAWIIGFFQKMVYIFSM